MNRRTTLGGISQSAANSRASRQSLGPSRTSNVGDVSSVNMKAKRASIAPGAMPLMATADRRGSMGPGRKSSLGMNNRKSSVVGGRSSTLGRIADPRNISDKSFMNGSIRQLIDYLTHHGFDHAISPKILTRPAVRDFNNIVLFLFRQIDPNFMTSGALQDEVINMFKLLRYPFQISKTNLVAVGSPTAWPALLATIMWLIELLRYDEEAVNAEADQDKLHEAEDPASSEKAFFTYLTNAYNCFMSGDDDTYNDLEAQFVDSFESTNEIISKQIEELEEKNKILSSEIAECNNRRAYLPELQARKRDYQHDHAKFKQLIEQLIKHREQLDTKKTNRISELKKLENNITAIESELESLKHRIANQELSPDDVKRMTDKKEKLQEQLESASEQKSNVTRKTWESEMSLRDKVIALEESSRAYNALAEELKLVPHTAKNANGRVLSVDIDTHAKKRSNLLKTDVRKNVVPILDSLKLEIAEQVSAMRNEQIRLQDENEEMESKINENEEGKTILEAKIRRAEEAFKREREALDSACVANEKEMDEMELRLTALRDFSSEETRAAQAGRQAAEARAARDARRKEHKRVKREMQEGIMEVVAQCANHRELIQERLKEIREKYGSKLQDLLSGNGNIRKGHSHDATLTQPVAGNNGIVTTSRLDGGNRFSMLNKNNKADAAIALDDVELMDTSTSEL